MVVKTNRENETWTNKCIIKTFGKKGIEILAETGSISKKECVSEREREEG